MSISTAIAGTPHPAIETGLTDVFERCRAHNQGKVATYIPELATMAPEQFGLALATIDGKLSTRGDADSEFTIQSVSKAFSYCLALELLGRDEVRVTSVSSPVATRSTPLFLTPGPSGRSIRWSMPARSRSAR
jgi:glutaminase